MSRGRLCVTAAGALVLALGPAGPVAADPLPPPSMQGETLTGDGITFSELTCTDSVAGSGFATFTTSGTATGPYPGAFTESGTVTLTNGLVTQFDADFTIDSPVGQVTGSKSLVTAAGTGGSCLSDFFNFNVLGASGTYVARQPGWVADSSMNTTQVQANGGGNHGQGFQEQFQFGDFRAAADAPATVTLTPPDAVNTVGSQDTVTATVRTTTGAAAVGATVLFSTTGSSTVSGSCTTDSSGQCTFTYTGPQLPGADVITGCADVDGNATADPGEPCGEATVSWIAPATTAGQAAGGGQVADASATDKVAFGFTAQSAGGRLAGTCTVLDPTGPGVYVQVKCLDVTGYSESGSHATFFGHATIDGASATYRIDVDDLGEPGVGSDSFKLQTSSGYGVGGVLLGGNIQVR